MPRPRPSSKNVGSCMSFPHSCSRFSKGASTSMSAHQASTRNAPEDDESSPFECNICLEMAKDPVVTLCGHLYCWPCLSKWFRSQQGTRMCPVCKSDLEGGRVVPIYCRASGQQASSQQKKHETERRPAGQYVEAEQNSAVAPTMSPLNSAGMGPTPGILPTLFGIYAGPQGARMTPEQQHQAFLTRLLLLLGSFVILCLLLF